jgi:hypothetical protein
MPDAGKISISHPATLFKPSQGDYQPCPTILNCSRQPSSPNSTSRFLYRHKPTGSQAAVPDQRRRKQGFRDHHFGPARDSTGVAHILEHSVLCGSRKYPVKEPFVELLKGSLQTFLNAFTYPDKTCYPSCQPESQGFLQPDRRLSGRGFSSPPDSGGFRPGRMAL